MEETKQFSYKFNGTNALRTLIIFYEDMEAADKKTWVKIVKEEGMNENEE